MCGRRDSPPKAPRLAPPPPAKEFMDWIDENSGVSVKTGMNHATGQRYRISQQLPRAPEDQIAYDNSGRLMNQIMDEIEQRRIEDPRTIVEANPYIRFFDSINQNRNNDLIELTGKPDVGRYITEFKDAEIRILDDNFAKYESEIMEDLNSRGYGNSSLAAETRSALAYQRAKAERELHRDALKYGYDSADREIDRNTNLYNLREAGRVGQIGAEEAKYGLQRDYAQSLIDQNQRAITNRAGLFEMAQGIRDRDIKKRMMGTQFAANQSLAEMQAENNAQYAGYNADVNRQVLQHRMDVDAFNSKPPSLEQKLIDGAIVAGGYMMGGPAGGAVASNITGNPNVPMIPNNQNQPTNNAWGNNVMGNPSSYFSYFAPPTNKPRVHANDVGAIRR